MANLLYANNAVGTLAAPITNASTSLTLNPGQAALFPNPSAPQVFYGTLTDASTQTLKEIVQVTAVAGNIMSIVRAQDGTSALSWNAGDIFEQCVIRLELQGFENAAEGLFGAQGVAITPSTTLGIKGTTAADNANAGSVGEFVSSTNTVLLTTGVPANVTSISLTAGDWDVSAAGAYTLTPITTLTSLTLGLSVASATFGGTGSFVQINASLPQGQSQAQATPVVRINVAGTTTVFLVSQAVFGGSTMNVQGLLRARRIR